MQRWLARLAFSFFILAAVLFWEAYQQWQRGAGRTAPLVDVVLAVALVGMGAWGTRERHRL